MPSNNQPPRPTKRVRLANTGPIIPRSGGKGAWQAKDYTKHVQWTPLKIGVFAAVIAILYTAIAIVVGLKLGFFAVIPLIALVLAILMIFVGLHWLAAQNF